MGGGGTSLDLDVGMIVVVHITITYRVIVKGVTSTIATYQLVYLGLANERGFQVETELAVAVGRPMVGGQLRHGLTRAGGARSMQMRVRRGVSADYTIPRGVRYWLACSQIDTRPIH